MNLFSERPTRDCVKAMTTYGRLLRYKSCLFCCFVVVVCLFFLFPSFLHFPLLLSVCNKPTFSLRIVILLTVGWFVCRPWLVKDYRQWNHLRYVNIFFVRFSVLQEIVEPHFPLLPNESDCFLPVNLIQTLLCCRKTMQ